MTFAEAQHLLTELSDQDVDLREIPNLGDFSRVNGHLELGQIEMVTNDLESQKSTHEHNTAHN